jgi:hypothetical protein
MKFIVFTTGMRSGFDGGWREVRLRFGCDHVILDDTSSSKKLSTK